MTPRPRLQISEPTLLPTKCREVAGGWLRYDANESQCYSDNLILGLFVDAGVKVLGLCIPEITFPIGNGIFIFFLKKSGFFTRWASMYPG